MILEGKYLKALIDEQDELGNGYNAESLDVIQDTVDNLLKTKTSSDRPGMLLGMIQSGKTKTFLGVIALAIDNGYQLAIVLTKGTRALTSQTFERLQKSFDTQVELDELRVFDIMSLPKLTPREQSIPLIVVVKKEKRNLERLQRALFETYPSLAHRKTLIIDDEADFASVGFRRSKTDAAELQAIMKSIDDVRKGLPNSSFLQVTATPYSLYLQPSSLPSSHGETFEPIRPAFTELVPEHDKYIGGKFYFEDSQVVGSVASFLYQPVEPDELDVLHQPDRRRFKSEEALTSNGVTRLRQAIVTFIVGGLIRRLQDKHANERPKKYSFLIHTESAKIAHAWQETVVESIVERLREAVLSDHHHNALFNKLVEGAYEDLNPSVAAAHGWMPPLQEVMQEVEEYLPAIQVEKVNSEKDVMQLLDREGQLRLRNRLNIFIGGQILDRGLTVANLIGFYYGRRANRFQQDTVLQHARMYGARPLSDLAVTRFYTSPEIYQVLETIHEFDSGLRLAFRKGGHEAGVVFIRKEGAKIIPCSPNKILVSSLTTLRPGKRLLPVGFQTDYKTRAEKYVLQIDRLIENINPSEEGSTLVPLPTAELIIDLIEKTLLFEDDSGYGWDVEAFKASMEYVSRISQNPLERGGVYLLVRTGRDNKRYREQSQRPFDAPDTSHVEGRIARQVAKTAPMLMLFRQIGRKDQGWRDTPFWWPVLYMPTHMQTVIFASDVNEYDDDIAQTTL